MAQVDLEAMSVAELTDHIAMAQRKLKEKQDAARAALLSKWKAEAAENNMPFEEVLSASTLRKPKAGSDKLPVKFKGPEGQEWSGRGKQPKWLADAEKQGRKREEFQV